MADQITTTMIRELRNRTGIGIGKCKEALEEANGDMEIAIANLRKAGMASAVKKAGRATHEGMIKVTETPQTVAVVETNAETDFVVKNALFQEFSQNIANEVATTTPESLDTFMSQNYSKDQALTIDQYRATVVQTIGENIQIRRFKTLSKVSNKTIGVYTHMDGKIVTLVEITGSSSEESLAKEIAMHITAAAPEYISEVDIPQNVLDHEKEIAKSQVIGKPENIIERIVNGKLNAFYDTVCLNRQKYIKDDKISIEELLNRRAKELGTALTITQFIRWTVGQ